MTAPTQRPAACSDARKRLAERNPAPTTDLCATAEQIASHCIELHKRGNPDPDGSTSTYRQAAEVIGGLVDALASRTPDAHLAAEVRNLRERIAAHCEERDHALEELADANAHLAAAKAEVLEDAALAVESDPGIRLGHNVSVVCSCLRCEVVQSCARLVRARAARLREQGGDQ